MPNRGWSIPDVYANRGGDLDACPECGGPKTKHGSVCIACRRRIGRASRSLADRFTEKVDTSAGLFDCWLWTGALDVHGYGRINVNRKSVKAARVALELAGMAIPEGMKALHRCDNPPCVNPAHLFIGSQADNIADMRAKGRARCFGRKLSAA